MHGENISAKRPNPFVSSFFVFGFVDFVINESFFVQPCVSMSACEYTIFSFVYRQMYSLHGMKVRMSSLKPKKGSHVRILFTPEIYILQHESFNDVNYYEISLHKTLRTHPMPIVLSGR